MRADRNRCRGLIADLDLEVALGCGGICVTAVRGVPQIRDDDEAGAIVETRLDAYVGEQVRHLGHHIIAVEELTCALAHGG